MTRSIGRYSPQTREALDRLGFDDPYDPAFIYRSVFGTAMRGHAQTWPDIDFDTLRSLNRDTAAWVHMDGTPLDYPVLACCACPHEPGDCNADGHALFAVIGD